MRVHHVIFVIAALLVGLGLKQYFFPPLAAQAEIPASPTASMNVLQMHVDHPNGNDLPVERMHDMSFIFDSE